MVLLCLLFLKINNNFSCYNNYTWARNGFDGIESKGECKQERYILNSSNFIIANNNSHFDSVALAA